MEVLYLGCGNQKVPGSIGIDINPVSDADVIHDLNVLPYPFEESRFDEIIADNVVEHLNDVVKVMEELSRISKPGARIKIMVPYFRSKWAFIDPTHRHYFTVESFAYFDPDHIICKLYRYSNVRFKVEKVIFNDGLKNGMVKSALVTIANKWPARYEHYLSHLLPLDQLTFNLVNLKES